MYPQGRQLLFAPSGQDVLVHIGTRLEVEPVECMRSERQKIRMLGDGWKFGSAEHFYRHQAAVPSKWDSGTLREPGKIGKHQHSFSVVLAHECQNAAVIRLK